jgi:sugar (pentulose or hexulose) kinase
VATAADELELALSAGTSFTGNLPCRTRVTAESETINVLQTPDGLTMLMVCARNGTIGFAQYVSSLAELSGRSFGDVADHLTDSASAVPPDCQGTMLWGFFQGENVVNLPHAKARLDNAGIDLLANPGLLARLLLESPCMTMRYGLEMLQPKIGGIRKVIVTGGVLKSKDGFAPQMYADILGVPVVGRVGDEEGTAKGAALLAAYMADVQRGGTQSLAEFAKSQTTGEQRIWDPDAARSKVYDERYQQFERGVHSWK